MNTHDIEPTREELEAFIFRAGFRWGWRELESWARRMAEQAVREMKALQSQDRDDAGLVEILREAAEIIAAVPTDYAPENLRVPIVDELEGFALMIDHARRIEDKT